MNYHEAKFRSESIGNKVIVSGQIVKKLFHKQNDRGMTLIEFSSRCVRRGEIHELVTTTHHSLKPRDLIDKVGFIGFIEIKNPGVIEKNDLVFAGESYVGRVIGFDECHFPNHYNILIESDQLFCANDFNLRLTEIITFIDPIEFK
ncbi:DUF6917 domain-containing protein [Brenneria tiliae]|uniref:DUF6917 domain-containing protein n=1 Tax=Brenneria tiliae TaxID=2914984 RepID=UPI002014993C|nr:hypothetical protein [Brenneria tiliae]MCL2897124.1 hypothetical protein [Brenneria tiliae]MCL2904777.1 hypothetical protein [Brenneria tiliae]